MYADIRRGTRKSLCRRPRHRHSAQVVLGKSMLPGDEPALDKVVTVRQGDIHDNDFASVTKECRETVRHSANIFVEAIWVDACQLLVLNGVECRGLALGKHLTAVSQQTNVISFFGAECQAKTHGKLASYRRPRGITLSKILVTVLFVTECWFLSVVLSKRFVEDFLAFAVYFEHTVKTSIPVVVFFLLHASGNASGLIREQLSTSTACRKKLTYI